MRGLTSAEELAAVVLTETVALPEVADELKVTGEPVTEQVGVSVAPAGDDVTAHAKVTVPPYPFDADTVTVELDDAPGVTEDGLAAAAESA
jgi:hypothetical protein